jgi:hypothetical protein
LAHCIISKTDDWEIMGAYNVLRIQTKVEKQLFSARGIFLFEVLLTRSFILFCSPPPSVLGFFKVSRKTRPEVFRML